LSELDDATWTEGVSTGTSPSSTLVGRYELGALVGRGGSGQVHLGVDVASGRTVALKFVPRRDPLELAAVRRELVALRRLRVPGVARLVDDFVDQGQHVLVTEYLPGPRLDVGLQERPHELLVEVLRTLSRVHRAGVLHLDLKPSNILLDGQGRATLLDFGIARGRVLRDERSDRSGTPAFMAPEQIAGRAVDARTDLYALGRILERSGRAAWCGLVASLTAADPDDRPASADAVLRTLGEPTDRDRLTRLDLGPLVGDAAAIAERIEAPGERFLHHGEDAAALAAAEPSVRALRACLLSWVSAGVLEVGDRWRLVRPVPLSSRAPVSAARALLDRGQVGRAWEVLAEAAPTAEVRLCQARVALASERRELLELARYHLDRSGEASPDVLALVDAGRAMVRGDAERARARLDNVVALPSETLERAWHGLRVWSARALGDVDHVLDSLRPWACRPERRAMLDGWEGQVAYARGDYARAAALQLRAGTVLGGGGSSALVHAAAATLELHDHDAAEAIAERALQSARRARHGAYEANAAWLARSAAYRRGDALVPDLEVADAARAVSAGLAGRFGMLEASIAWRCDDPVAEALAGRAAADHRDAGEPVHALFCEALAVAAGADPGDVLARAAAVPPSDIQLQILALAGCPRVHAEPAIDATGGPVAVRRDVLSVVECLERLRD
jgi:serine/threonine-protein kinase